MGPNAMRGRGIGTARGRATIMRGMSFVLIDSRFLLANPPLPLNILTSLNCPGLTDLHQC